MKLRTAGVIYLIAGLLWLNDNRSHYVEMRDKIVATEKSSGRGLAVYQAKRFLDECGPVRRVAYFGPVKAAEDYLDKEGER